MSACPNVRGLNSILRVDPPSLVTCHPLPRRAVRRMLEWPQVSRPALCPRGAVGVGTPRLWWELYVESDHQPLPIYRFPPSPFTFSSLPDTPLNKTESSPWAAMFPKFPREGSNLVSFSCLQSRIPAVMPGRATHHGLPNAPSTFQHRSFPNFHPFCTNASPF